MDKNVQNLEAFEAFSVQWICANKTELYSSLSQFYWIVQMSNNKQVPLLTSGWDIYCSQFFIIINLQFCYILPYIRFYHHSVIIVDNIIRLFEYRHAFSITHYDIDCPELLKEIFFWFAQYICILILNFLINCHLCSYINWIIFDIARMNSPQALWLLQTHCPLWIQFYTVSLTFVQCHNSLLSLSSHFVSFCHCYLFVSIDCAYRTLFQRQFPWVARYIF